MISPNTSPARPPSTLPPDPHALSVLTSSSVFPHILSFCPKPALGACLRVSHAVSHMAASALYRDISLIHILPPAIPVPSPDAKPRTDTRSPFLRYVRTLRLPPHSLYDPSLCSASINHMERLQTVVVQGDWQGWILRPNPLRPIFGSTPRRLKVILTGLKSPAALINNGLIQSDLLTHAEQVVLCIDYLNPAYRSPRQRVTDAMGGLRYSTDLPSSVRNLTILLPPATRPEERRPRLPAGFELGADSGFFHNHLSQGFCHNHLSQPVQSNHGVGLVDYESEPDVAPDLARVIMGRKDGCEVVIVARGPKTGMPMADENYDEGVQRRVEAEKKLLRLRQRTEKLVDELKLAGQHSHSPSGDGDAPDRERVKWVSDVDREGQQRMEDLLGNPHSGSSPR